MLDILAVPLLRQALKPLRKAEHGEAFHHALPELRVLRAVVICSHLFKIVHERQAGIRIRPQHSVRRLFQSLIRSLKKKRILPVLFAVPVRELPLVEIPLLFRILREEFAAGDKGLSDCRIQGDEFLLVHVRPRGQNRGTGGGDEVAKLRYRLLKAGYRVLSVPFSGGHIARKAEDHRALRKHVQKSRLQQSLHGGILRLVHQVAACIPAEFIGKESCHISPKLCQTHSAVLFFSCHLFLLPDWCVPCLCSASAVSRKDLHGNETKIPSGCPGRDLRLFISFLSYQPARAFQSSTPAPCRSPPPGGG